MSFYLFRVFVVLRCSGGSGGGGGAGRCLSFPEISEALRRSSSVPQSVKQVIPFPSTLPPSFPFPSSRSHTLVHTFLAPLALISHLAFTSLSQDSNNSIGVRC